MADNTNNYGLVKPTGSEKVDIAVINGNMDKIDAALAGKVDKVTGKGLSTNDFTDADKSKLDSLDNYEERLAALEEKFAALEGGDI